MRWKIILNLVNQRRPFVQLEEPFAVFASTSSCTMLYKFVYFVGFDKYLFSNLCSIIIQYQILEMKHLPISTTEKERSTGFPSTSSCTMQQDKWIETICMAWFKDKVPKNM